MFSKLSIHNPKVRPQPMLHHISRCVTQIRFYRCCSYATVPIRVYKTFVYPPPVRTLWLKESPSRDSVGAFPSQMKMTFCRQSPEIHKGKDTEQTPQSKVSKIIIALTTFFHSLIISYHIWIRDFPKNWKQLLTTIIWYQPL